MMSTTLRLVLAVLLALAVRTLAAEPKPDAPARLFKNTGEGAELVAATFLGGGGHEWLCGGAFAADGSIIVVGNVVGPDFDWAKASKVIGNDLPKPPAAQRVPVLEKGQPKVGKDGNVEYEKPSWRHAGTTAFVARLSPDLKQVLAVSRFPWTAGAATSVAVDAAGEIYVAGKAGEGIASLGNDIAEFPAMPADAKVAARCDHAFIAKLSADGASARWVRHVKGPCAAPSVSVAADGNLLFGAGNLFTIDSAGKLIATRMIPDGVRTTASINPKDGTLAIGGEHHWPTGREPWRCPTLNIFGADGKLKHQFYDWGGPYVGLNNCRQVSDSAIRLVTHGADGGILMYAWSDGGNSVMTTEPFDVRAPVAPKGLGMTAAGAGVLSCAYLISLDPLDYHVRAWTFWSATAQNNKPNSIWVQAMTRTPGGALAVAGNGAWGVWQTATKMSDAEPTGEYVAVFSEDFGQLRFCSIIPGAGVAEVSDGAAGRGAQWGIASAKVNGKTRVLFVGSAQAGREENGRQVATSTREPVQAVFGGGWCDGYAVLLELPEGASHQEAAAVRQPIARASFEQAAKGKDAKRPQRLPEEGATFHFLSDYPKYVTADVEIRAHDESKWPAFFYGKSVDGKLVYHAKGSEGDLTVACPALCQPAGEQKKRVIGELVKDPKAPPTVKFTLSSLSEAKTAEVKYVDKGNEKTRTVEYFDGKGSLELGGRQIAISPRVTTSYSGPKDGPVEEVYVSAFVTLGAAELGLAALPPTTPIDIRISMTGTTRTQAAPKSAK